MITGTIVIETIKTAATEIAKDHPNRCVPNNCENERAIKPIKVVTDAKRIDVPDVVSALVKDTSNE